MDQKNTADLAKASPKRTRVQLNFTEGAMEELVELEKEMGLSRQELFRYALRWLQFTFDELKQGGEILVKEASGEVKKVVSPFLTG